MDPNTTRKTSLRPHFSILTLVLLTTIVALAMGLFLASTKHRAEQDSWQKERETLLLQLNRLDVTSRSKVVAKRIRDGNPHARRWRVYLPPGKRWRVKMFSGLIPTMGYNVETATNNRNGHFPVSVDIPSQTPVEGVTLEAAIFNHDNKGWVLQLEGPKNILPRGYLRTKLVPDAVKYLEGQRQWGSYSEGRPMPEAQGSFSRDEPLGLWRKQWTAMVDPASGHQPGFIVWMEPLPVENAE
jgi:hypothetical protein